MNADLYQPTDHTRLRRLPERGAYDRATVHAILDEGFICHLGFVVDGQPYVIPTGYAASGCGRAWTCASPSPCSTGWCSPAQPSTTR